MKKISKRKKGWLEKLKKGFKYDLDEAITLLKEFSKLKFDAGVDLAFCLGIDTKKSDQIVKGTCLLPNGTGKTVKVLAITKGEKEKEAKDAGADYVGNEEFINKIKEGWLDFDRVVATPDMMPEVGKIGKILGPRGLLPNPKMGTVTVDLAKIIKRIKKGMVEFKTDKSANLFLGIGKISFSEKKIKENVLNVVETITKLKPATSKGIYLKKIYLSSTMGPGIELNPQSLN